MPGHELAALGTRRKHSTIVLPSSYIFCLRKLNISITIYNINNVFTYRLSKIYNRIHRLKQHLAYFAGGIWEFKSENVQKMLSLMNPEDKTLFDFDIRDFDRLDHVLVSKLGTRYYYLKEKMETLPQAQRKNTVWADHFQHLDW